VLLVIQAQQVNIIRRSVCLMLHPEKSLKIMYSAKHFAYLKKATATSIVSEMA